MNNDHSDARKDQVENGPMESASTSEVCISCCMCRRNPLDFDCLCEICVTCNGCKIEHLHRSHNVQECECSSKDAEEGSEENKAVSCTDFEDEGRDDGDEEGEGNGDKEGESKGNKEGEGEGNEGDEKDNVKGECNDEGDGEGGNEDDDEGGSRGEEDDNDNDDDGDDNITYPRISKRKPRKVTGYRYRHHTVVRKKKNSKLIRRWSGSPSPSGDDDNDNAFYRSTASSPIPSQRYKKKPLQRGVHKGKRYKYSNKYTQRLKQRHRAVS